MSKPKVKNQPRGESVRATQNPESYLSKTPVWRFADFDWDGPFGLESCESVGAKLIVHIRQHLASYETMTWNEILSATGGRSVGNNNHLIEVRKFKKSVQERLREKKIFVDHLFSLRLDATTRVYGVRETNILRIVLFDPFHKDKDRCAYEFSS